ncbi:MAG TPA: HesA/MoeB/ThiF family protein [Polyangiaceae bacterium]|jgi:adenylyltransferase/sulfurtransferase|nr:HesA/MoeB/ThiF family protein [Polyangiaceae bacterium]
MNTSPDRLSSLRILLVGTGGVGAPCAIALAEAGVGTLVLADEDRVEMANLHRQLLFDESDIGQSKLEAAKRSLEARRPGVSVELFRGRALPTTAHALARNVDAVVDATDNFASRFLLADACRLAEKPVVHAAAIRWIGTVVSAGPRGGPCYRCLFEDLPETAPDCASAGIVGPVCGVVGGIAAEMALLAALGDGRLWGRVATFDGLSDELRLLPMARRDDCVLCGRAPTIVDLVETRYTSGHPVA